MMNITQAMMGLKYSLNLLICINILLQVAAFCLIKASWLYAHHSVFNLMNYMTVAAFSVTFLRAYLWQRILKMSDLSSCYLPNAIVPSMLVLAGCFIFNEHVTYFNVLGSAIIFVGLVFLMKSKSIQ